MTLVVRIGTLLALVGAFSACSSDTGTTGCTSLGGGGLGASAMSGRCPDDAGTTATTSSGATTGAAATSASSTSATATGSSSGTTGTHGSTSATGSATAGETTSSTGSTSTATATTGATTTVTTSGGTLGSTGASTGATTGGSTSTSAGSASATTSGGTIATTGVGAATSAGTTSSGSASATTATTSSGSASATTGSGSATATTSGATTTAAAISTGSASTTTTGTTGAATTGTGGTTSGTTSGTTGGTTGASTFTVGGDVTGFADGTLVLANNGGDDVTLLADGGNAQSFVFPTALTNGSGFDVTVESQPFDMTCTIDGGSGFLAGANVTDVAVACACAAGDTLCVGGCTDLSTDPQNCGSCGKICVSGVCGSTLSAPLDVPPTGWVVNGDSFLSDAGTLVVTPDETNQAGTLIYENPIAADSFTVTFDFKLTVADGGRIADGVAFMLETNDAGIVGATGGGLGMTNLDGFGVELDTYNNNNCSDDSANHAGIDSLTACAAGTPTELARTADLSTLMPALTLADGAWHTAEVDMVTGVINLKIDGTNEPFIGTTDLTLSGFSGTTPYYFGFSGATGSAHTLQEIRNVVISFPATTCQ